MSRIFLNPGHCVGLDPGAIDNGLQEADITLKICRLTEAYLLAVGLTTKLFQYDGLEEICNASNSFNADLFISVHCNAADSPAAHGTETFYFQSSVNGEKLARCIQNQITSSLGTFNRGIKPDNSLYVLKHTAAPAVLVELAFITNSRDAKLLAYYQDSFARATARGITDFFISK